jgi:5-methylcytosine-specific restriction endonuclease McrA
MVCIHHVLTRKAWPEFENESFNHMPLCQRHHNEAHSYGNTKFAAKYPGAAQWFADNGWSIRDGKWIPKLWN